ncbi:hypothetical protein C770_GR4pC0475 (plasmid) [Sinorhizobium meliloti GR4]|nr:hypothetical protein C770_GR4pC0475 [Sinorhizobium meliloti GR4]
MRSRLRKPHSQRGIIDCAKWVEQEVRRERWTPLCCQKELSSGCECKRSQQGGTLSALQPPSDAGLVGTIDVAEHALEVDFLAGDHAVAHGEVERYQRDKESQAIEADGEADQAEKHADIDRVTAVAVRTLVERSSS